MKIKIEDITYEILKAIEENADLYALRLRFLQLWDKYFDGNCLHSIIQKAGPINRIEFLQKYLLLSDEFKSRNLTFNTHSIDKYLMRKNFLRGVSPAEIGDIIIAQDCICVQGDILHSPKTAVTMDISIRKDIKDFLETTLDGENSVIVKAIKNQIDDGVEIKIMDTHVPGEKHVPLFDLVLRPHGTYTTKTWDTGQVEETNYHIDNVIVTTIEAKELRKKDESFVYTCKIGDIDIGSTETTKESFAIGTKLKVEINKNSFSDHGEMNLASHKIVESSEDAETTIDDYNKLLKTLFNVKLKKFADFKINKLHDAQHIAGGIVYEPDVIDLQGDFTDQEEIQKAMYYFMEKQHQMKVMHGGIPRDDIVVLENFQAEVDTIKGGQLLRKGAWYLTVKVNDEGLWQDIESGEITGFSLGGYSQAQIM